ncbi:MAG TPA: amidohydrolase family protein [Methylobacterium sp.]|nr:amidohydrolase family protein [Methylobacterium sp.]
MPRPIVDMRSRPSFLHPFFGADPNAPEDGVVRWLNGRVGAKEVAHYTRGRSIEGFVSEMDGAGIAVAVMVARSVPGVRVSNDDLAAAARHDPKRLIGIASVDPVELGRDAAVAEARRAVTELGFKGINLDAGFYGSPMRADDERLMPLYELCQTLAVPAFVMSGPTTPDLRLNDPLAVDRVAKTFPKLPIVCCHGFYPHVDAMVTVAFRNENVYVSPDMYTFAPGGGLYVEAANGFLRDQFLFGSSFPFRPMGQGVADFTRLGLTEEALDHAYWRNADRLLGLGLTEAGG